MDLSRDQLRRIERCEVAVRFFPAWEFCRFTDTSPLWLAFGDPEKPSGFVSCANSTVSKDAGFLEVMRKYGERYRTLRFLIHSSWFEGAAVFSDSYSSLLDADFIQLKRRAEQVPKKNLARLLIKRYLIPHMSAAPLTWEVLRTILVSKTDSPQAKADLAKYLGVSLAAISQWRSKANAPTADKTLRILAWVRRTEAKQKKSAGSVSETRPARKTQERKSKHERPNSGRKKQ